MHVGRIEDGHFNERRGAPKEFEVARRMRFIALRQGQQFLTFFFFKLLVII